MVSMNPVSVPVAGEHRLRELLGQVTEWTWGVPVALAVLLVAADFHNHLLFHTLAELFTVMIAVLLFVVTWQAYPFSKNNFLMFLACGYFWVGGLDLAHTLAYKGMNIIETAIPRPAAQLWIAARYLQSLLLLAAPFFLERAVMRKSLFLSFGVVAAVLFILIMSGNFPEAYIEGRGLTPFKIISEYVIIGILAGALAHMTLKRTLMTPQVFVPMAMAVVLTMASELAFTLYGGINDPSVVVGHILKLFAFWLIFVAAVRTTLHEPYQALQREISGHNRTEKARRESDELNREIVAGALDAIISINSEETVMQFNPAAEKMFGYSRNQAVGAAVSDLIIPEKSKAHHKQGVRSFLESGGLRKLSNPREIDALRADGTEFPVEISIMPVRTSAGDICTAIIRDLTERREAERNLRQVQNMDSLGNLAGGIAHDINNMLMPILNLTQMVARKLPEGEPERRKLDMVIQAAEKIRDLVSKILTYSRRGEGEMKVTDSFEAVREAVNLLRSILPSTITIREILDREAGTIIADRAQIGAVLMNLGKNSADAMEGKTGSLEISLSRADVDTELAKSVHNLKAGIYVLISVADTGPGMGKEILGHVLDPFFTTKGKGRGTGLGLSMVFNIVTKHGGALSISSEPGKGTAVKIYLPLAPAPETI